MYHITVSVFFSANYLIFVVVMSIRFSILHVLCDFNVVILGIIMITFELLIHMLRDVNILLLGIIIITFELVLSPVEVYWQIIYLLFGSSTACSKLRSNSMFLPLSKFFCSNAETIPASYFVLVTALYM